MLYEAHRDTFLFSPDPYRRTALESCRDEFHRFQLFRASIYIYICGWKKDPTMEFFLFTHAPLFFQFVVIFLRERIEQQAFTLGENMMVTRRGVGLYRKKTRDRKN